MPQGESVEIRPQPGPQEDFLASAADIVVFGGSAGGGKSYGLILETLRHSGNPKFGGVVFRRTSPQLTGVGSIWEEARGLYPLLGAKMIESPSLEATFPSGALIQFLHLQHEKTVHDHQGKQYALIAFDELTHFEEQQFWYMVSRLRSVSGVAPYMRCTTNPDPDHFVRRLIAWWVGIPECADCQTGDCRLVEHGYANPDRSGVVRYFTRIGGALYWADTREDCEQIVRDHGLEVGVTADVMSFTFISSKLDDNPALLSRDPGYKARLMALPEVDRERLLGGNWNIRPEAGKYISLDMFATRWTPSEIELDQHERPKNMHVYIASDYAVTEKTDNNKPDWTEHGVFGVDCHDNVFVLDWWHGQTTADVWIEVLIDKIARWKPLKVFGEGGVIRKSVEPFLERRMRERRTYASIEWINAPRADESASKQGYSDRSKRAKAIKARAFQARAAMGKWIFPASEPWADRVIQQCVGFPFGPDDAFDVCALMGMGIDQAHGAAVIPIKPVQERDRWADKFKRKGGRSWKTV